MYYYAGIYEEGNFPGESFTSAPLDISFSSDGQYLYSLNEVLYSIDVYKVDIERQTLTLHSSVVSLQDSLSLDLANFSSSRVLSMWNFNKNLRQGIPGLPPVTSNTQDAEGDQWWEYGTT